MGSMTPMRYSAMERFRRFHLPQNTKFQGGTTMVYYFNQQLHTVPLLPKFDVNKGLWYPRSKSTVNGRIQIDG